MQHRALRTWAGVAGEPAGCSALNSSSSAALLSGLQAHALFTRWKCSGSCMFPAGDGFLSSSLPTGMEWLCSVQRIARLHAIAVQDPDACAVQGAQNPTRSCPSKARGAPHSPWINLVQDVAITCCPLSWSAFSDCLSLGGVAPLLGTGTLQESLSMPPSTGLLQDTAAPSFDGSVTCRTQFPVS